MSFTDLNLTFSCSDEQKELIVLVINKNRKLLINDNELQYGSLRTKLAAIYQNKSRKEIYIQADQSVSYGYVAQVMAEVKRAGITKVGLVTEPGEVPKWKPNPP